MEKFEERRPETEGILSVDDLAKGMLVSERFRPIECALDDGFVADIADSITWE